MNGIRTVLGALAFAAGIILADLVQPGARWAAAAGAAAAASLVAAAVLHRRNPEPDVGSLLPALHAPVAALLIAGLAAGGFGSLGLRLSAMNDAVVPRHDGERLTISGRLVTDPRPDDYANRFYLAVREAGNQNIREKVAVTAYGRLPKIELGDSIRMRAKIKRLDVADPFDSSLARKSIVAKASISAAEIRLLDKSHNPALTAANHFRSRIAAAAEAGAGGSRAPLLLGLVIGDQRNIPEKVTEDFRAAGLSHLTAVSGQNVAMVMAPLVLAMMALRLKRRVQVVVSLWMLAFFALVTRWEPSVLRATLMAAAVLSAWLFGRRADAVHLLAFVFFVLLAVDPLLLWSIGFQLSFAATAGILLLGPYLAGRLGHPFSGQAAPEGEETGPATVPGSRPPPQLPDTGRTGGSDIRPARLSGRFLQLVAIGMAAQGAVLPLIALHFGRMSLVSLPANLAAAPLVAPVTVLGLSGGLVGLVSQQAAKPFMFLAGLFVAALQLVARSFGGSEHAQVSLGGWSALEIAAASLAAGAAILWLGGRGRLARWPAVVGVLTAVVAGMSPVAGAGLPSGMRLTFFDVGQGDAALVESVGGARIVIDGGPDPGDLADRLKRREISRLDLVIASHGHTDHVAGLGEVMRRFKVRTAVDPGVPTAAMEAVAAVAGGSSSQIFEAVSDRQGMRIGDLTVDFLGPSPGTRVSADPEASTSTSSEGSELNDASVVARISFGEQCVLFTGDLEEQGQDTLLELHKGAIDCTILKAPHHGSGRLVAEFVKAADPEWIAVSVGRNDYGHPAPRALSIFGDAGARILRTDRMGDIVLNVNRAGGVTLER